MFPFKSRIVWFAIAVFAFHCNCSVYAQAFKWIDTDGPHGGTIMSMAVDSFGSIYAGVFENGIMRSDDHGATWLLSGLPTDIVYSMAVAPDGDIYATCYYAGVMRSTNRGASWISCYNKSPGLIRTITINAHGDMFVCADGILRSRDSGNTWQMLDVNQTGIYCDLIACNSMGTLYAVAGGTGIIASTDNGDHWHVTSTFDSTWPPALVFTMTFASDSTILIATSEGVMRSSNAGKNWTDDSNSFGVPLIGSVFNGPGGKLYAVADAPYVSTDSGAHWKKCCQRFFGNWGRSGVASANGSLFVGTQNSGVYASYNEGATWRETDIGARGMMSLTVDSSNNVFAATDGGGVYRYDRAESRWRHCGLDGANMYSLLTDDSGTVYAGVYSGSCDTTALPGVYRSTNNGTDWERTSNGLGQHAVYVMASDSGGWMYAGTDSGMYRSSDRGGEWGLCSPAYSFNTTISCGNGFVFASGWTRGPIFSTDHGTTWHSIDSIPGDGSLVALVSDRRGNWYAGFTGDDNSELAGGVFRSRDSGRTWQLLYPDRYKYAGSDRITALAVDNRGTLVIGVNASSSNDAKCSTDGGTTWDAAEGAVGGGWVESLVLDTNGVIWVGTNTGAFRSSRSTIVDVQRVASLPQSLHLNQNFPNPWTHATVISFCIPGGASNGQEAVLSLYDMHGRKLSTVFHGPASDVERTVNISTGDLPAGCYEYVLTCGGLTQKKMCTVVR